MPRQLRNDKPDPKPYRKLYLKALNPNVRKLEQLDDTEKELKQAYKLKAIPKEHYKLLMQGIHEERLIVGERLRKREEKIAALLEQEQMENMLNDRDSYLRMFCNMESISKALLNEDDRAMSMERLFDKYSINN